MALKIYEIFHSLQGESSRIGLPTVFIRLTGCPMRCNYCDTEYAFSGGNNMTTEQILSEVAKFKTKYITVTGGEPLAQKECYTLLTELSDSGFDVSLETGGAMDIANVDKRVSIILDVKTPGSSEDKNMRWTNLDYVKPSDEIKFVLCHRDDYNWAKKRVEELKLTDRCSVLFSPSYHELSPADLAAWVLEDQLNVRMQVQMHKVLWGEKPGV